MQKLLAVLLVAWLILSVQACQTKHEIESKHQVEPITIEKSHCPNLSFFIWNLMRMGNGSTKSLSAFFSSFFLL